MNNLDILAQVAVMQQHKESWSTSSSDESSMLITPSFNSGSESEHEEDDEPIQEKKTAYRLPESAKTILRQWFDRHVENPYPDEHTKLELQDQCGLTMRQVNNFFINVSDKI